MAGDYFYLPHPVVVLVVVVVVSTKMTTLLTKTFVHLNLNSVYISKLGFPKFYFLSQM